MAEDIDLIALPRRGGKTTRLLEHAFKAVEDMRSGKSKRGSVVIVTMNHREQERLLELVYAGMVERGISFTKSTASDIYVASQSSLERLHGTKPRYIFIDDADCYDEGLAHPTLYPLRATAEVVVATYTPPEDTVIELVERLDRWAEEERQVAADLKARGNWELKDQMMRAWMEAKIRGDI